MDPQIPQRRFYIGSAAIFWFLVALVIGSYLFTSLRGAFPVDVDVASRWSVALYFSAPAIVAGLLAVLVRNVTRFDGLEWRSALLAWLIAPLAFAAVGFAMVAFFAPFAVGH
jgi:hypothetical protein